MQDEQSEIADDYTDWDAKSAEENKSKGIVTDPPKEDPRKDSREEAVPSNSSSSSRESVAKSKAVVEVSEEGFLQAKTIEGRYRIAQYFCASGMVPKSFKTAEQVLAGMEFALEIGLKPLSGLRNIAVINGSPSIWGDLPLSLAKRTGELKSISEKIFDRDYNEISFENKNLTSEAWGAVCIVESTIGLKAERFFTLDDAEKAGLLGRDNVWKTYPRRMLQMRARSHALKDVFPEVYAGVPIAEYDFNVLPSHSEVKDVTPRGEDKFDIAASLNDLAEGADESGGVQ
jgi:hypothetical protein